MPSFLSFFRKDATAGDTHVTTAIGNEKDKKKKKPKAQSFSTTIGQNTKLPVTKPDAAAMAEQTLGKSGARHSKSDMALLQTIHDHACALGASCPTDGIDPDAAAATYAKGDTTFSIPVTVMKADPDQQLIFGWASVVEQDGKIIVDKQGDMISPEELEKAAYDFTLYDRRHGDMHELVGTGRMVESMVFTKDKQAALGIDLKKVGWWVGFKVDDPRVWAGYKRGERPEFSIGGVGQRVES